MKHSEWRLQPRHVNPRIQDYWRKRVSANDEMLSVKEPVFAELTNIRKVDLSEEKEPLLISFNQLQLAVSTPAQAELAAVLISRMQSLC